MTWKGSEVRSLYRPPSTTRKNHNLVRPSARLSAKAPVRAAGALRFYSGLFGWRKGPGHDMGPMGVYQIFEHGGTQVGGMCRPGSAHAAPSWLSYVHVADSNRAVAATKAAGGRLVHGPIEVPGGSWIALLTDPQGGSFAVQEAPRTSQAKAAPAARPAAAPKPAAAFRCGARICLLAQRQADWGFRTLRDIEFSRDEVL